MPELQASQDHTVRHCLTENKEWSSSVLTGKRHDSIDFIHVLVCACTCRGQKTLDPVKLNLQIVVIV